MHKDYTKHGWSPDTGWLELVRQELGERVALAYDDELSYGNPVWFMESVARRVYIERSGA